MGGTIAIGAVCPPRGPLERCFAFGDLAYLRRGVYEKRIRRIMKDAVVIPPRKGVKVPNSTNLSLGTVYLFPYVAEDWPDDGKKTDVPPKGLASFFSPHKSIRLPDIRMDHFGLL